MSAKRGKKVIKPVSKKAQERAEYEAWLEKHRLESERNLTKLRAAKKVAEKSFWDETTRKNAVLPPRLEQKYTPGVGAKKDTLKYTGDKMMGIATMHKSSMVPVFSGEEAIDISKMRRG